MKNYRSLQSSSVLLFVLLAGCGGGDFIGSSVETGGAAASMDGGVDSGNGATTGTGGNSDAGPGGSTDAGNGGSGGARGTGGLRGSGGHPSGGVAGRGGATDRDASGDGGTTGGGSGGTQSGGTTSAGGTGVSGTTGNGGSGAAGANGGGGTTGSGGATSGGSAGVAGGGGACTNPSTWYVDADQDGYGSRTTPAIVSCAQPVGHYVKVGGDCDDDEPDVHPQVTQQEMAYFDKPYKAPNGTDSFDYDCSGVEDGEPGLPKGATSCPALTLGSCSGSGYLTVSAGNRIGALAYCGSRSYRNCVSQTLSCSTQDTTNFPTAYRCR